MLKSCFYPKTTPCLLHYTYLGVTISKNGLKHSAQDLALKAQKAWFSLKHVLYSTKIKNVKMIIHLFDMCIKPILIYGSEIWGPNFNTHNLFNLQNKTENVQLQCCKWVLNVARNCTNLGVLGELGRYPMLQTIQLNSMKYWIHLENLPKHRLLYKVYQIAKTKKSKWYTYITQCLKNMNLNIASVTIPDSISRNAFIKDLKLKLIHVYNTTWKAKLTTGTNQRFNSKLRTYITFKDKICMEPYLLMDNNIKSRELFTKFRLSDHRLEIESGRRRNIKLEDRICQQCQNIDKYVEDEFHLVIKCEKYSKYRSDLLTSISTTQTHFLSLSERQKFKYIMSYQSNMFDIVSFIQNCFNLRGDVNLVTG